MECMYTNYNAPTKLLYCSLLDSLFGDVLIAVTSDGLFSSFRVKSVKDLQMNVNLCGGKFHGRVHVTQISDEITQVRICLET